MIAAGLTSARTELPGLSTIAVGLTGLPGFVRPDRLAAAISGTIRAERIVIASDSLITHIGALNMASGTVLAAGTGAIALTTDHLQTWQQADGWGALLGDIGGGFWIGRQGLQAALRAYDDRDAGSTALLDRLRQRFGDPLSLIDQVYTGAAASQLLASFAPDVASAADGGDPIAAGIWRRAGQHLARTAAAAAAHLPAAPISWGGGLFQAGNRLLDPFSAELERLRPGIIVQPPQQDAVGGALHLARAGRTRTSRPPYLYVYDTADLNGPTSVHQTGPERRPPSRRKEHRP